jgi:hypothetical protein
MKTIVAQALLATLGFAAAGCASAKEGRPASATFNTVDSNSPSGVIFVVGRKTFAGLKVGTPIVCQGGEPTANVPSSGKEILVGGHWSGYAATTPSADSLTLDVWHRRNGKVTVTCTRN